MDRSTTQPGTDPRTLRTGVAFATAAFLWWGLSPVYWKAVGAVPAPELLAHRVVTSVVLLAVWLWWRGRGADVLATLRRPKARTVLTVTAALLSVNWLTYIWAMGAERVLEASLGYYINPLVNVVLGIAFLGERLRRPQMVAVALAAAGVAVLTWEVGSVPWVALVLAGTFGVYGLLRKTVDAGPEVGLLLETAVMTPFAVAGLVWLGSSGRAVFPAVPVWTQGLVLAACVITVLPLVWFTHGARRLPLATLGLLQYLSPTGQFLLAVLVYREPFTPPHLVAFVLIWSGLAVFTWELRGRAKVA